MYLNSLFIRPKRSIGGVQIDGTLQESHDTSVIITKNPVEFGADITDHVIVQPSKIAINGVITDTPLNSGLSLNIGGATFRYFGSSTPTGGTRSQQGYSALVSLQQAREPISIQTKLTLYQNMIITSIKVNQDKSTSNSVYFNLSAEEIIVVGSEIVLIPREQLESGKVEQQASSPQEAGRKESNNVPSNTSWLKSGKDFLFGG